jgi:hypothetical protein
MSDKTISVYIFPNRMNETITQPFKSYLVKPIIMNGTSIKASYLSIQKRSGRKFIINLVKTPPKYTIIAFALYFV